MNKEVIDGILTFDELLEDDYYKSEFEKRYSRGWKNITITQKEAKCRRNSLHPT